MLVETAGKRTPLHFGNEPRVAFAKGGFELMNAKSVAYWVTTGFLAFNSFSGGVAELARLPGNVEGTVFLGYPVSFLAIIGTWKVLGTIALLVPRFPRLKEW